MNNEEKKRPGRPRKYATDAERKKAYRERKKEEFSKMESRTKRINELQGRLDNMERKLMKTTYKDDKLPPEYSEIHEMIKARSEKYNPSELIDMDIEQLKRIRNSINNRYHGSYYNPLLAALESAIMPSVDREFDSRKLGLGEKPYEVVVKEKLAKTDDTTTPKTDVKIDEYIKKLKEEGVEISEEEETLIRSTMEKRNDGKQRSWANLKDIFRTDQLFDVFQEMILLYTVEAEIARRDRETSMERKIEKLEKQAKELEKSLTDEKLRKVKRSSARRKGKKDDN